MQLRISQEGNDSTTLQLSEEQGRDIRTLLEQNIDCRFTSLCHKIGMNYSNAVAMLGGRRKVSVKQLRRLFSTTDFTIECRTEFIIQKRPTSDAHDVDCTSLEDELFLEAREELTEELLNERESCSITEESLTQD